jgi:aspartate aminotransferase
MKLADRTTRIAGSPTMKVTATVDRLRRSGVEVVDFGAGEPDFPTPDAIKAAAHKALDDNFTRYTPAAGIADLKRAICDRYRSDYGVEYSEAQVIVTAGGKQALYNTALSLFGPGDEVITHAPFWPTLTEQIKLADATPVLARTHVEDGSRSTRARSSAPSRRAPAASSSTRQATRPARSSPRPSSGRLARRRRSRASGWSSISATSG